MVNKIARLFEAIRDGIMKGVYEPFWRVLTKNWLLTVCFLFIMLGIMFLYGQALTDQAETIHKQEQKIDDLQDKIQGLELDLDEAWETETELRRQIWQFNDYMQKELAE